ncbi:hypothetical protein Tco_0992939, partial [Tanacetum coccineum]
ELNKILEFPFVIDSHPKSAINTQSRVVLISKHSNSEEELDDGEVVEIEDKKLDEEIEEEEEDDEKEEEIPY